MKDYTVCPICNKSGIPNYMNEDVKCPCCGTDLSIYRKIELAKASARKPNKIVWLLGAFIVLILIGYPLIISSYRKKIAATEEQYERIMAERDSLSKLVEVYQSDGVDDDIKTYIVKKGDSFCRISKRLYGAESRFMEIVEGNNLTLSTILHEGDTLKIR